MAAPPDPITAAFGAAVRDVRRRNVTLRTIGRLADALGTDLGTLMAAADRHLERTSRSRRRDARAHSRESSYGW